MASTSEKIEFKNQEGQLLSAKFEIAGSLEEGGPIAIFAHCFTCSKDVFAANRVSKNLTSAGISVFRFDFTGLGSSDGDFANTNFSSNVQDLLAANDYLTEKYHAPTLLIGHSLGGAAVLAATYDLEKIKGVVTIGAPADPAHVVHHFKADREKIDSEGLAEVSLAGRSFTIKKQFIDDLERQEQEKRIEKLKAALLIFHSPQDNTVGIENAQKIYQSALHPKSFVSLDGADHLLSKAEDSRYVAEIIAAWAVRYL